MENTNNKQSMRMGLTIMLTYERDSESYYDEIASHIHSEIHKKLDELRKSHNIRGTIETTTSVPRLSDSGVHLVDLGFLSIMDLRDYMRYGLINAKGYEELYRELNLAGHNPDLYLRKHDATGLAKLLRKYRRSFREDGTKEIMKSICEQVIRDVRAKYEDGLLSELHEPVEETQ